MKERDAATNAQARKIGLVVLAVIMGIAVIVGFAGAIGGSSTRGVSSASADGHVSAEEFGDRWPLTVESGELQCDALGVSGNVQLTAVTFTAPDGTTYALNGTAKDHTDFANADAIWADNAEIEGTKINIAPLIERGLKLCG